MPDRQIEVSSISPAKWLSTSQRAIGLMVSRIKESRRAADIEHQTTLMNGYIKNLACDFDIALKENASGHVIGIVCDKSGVETAQIRLTVGDMGAGEPDYNGVVIERKADGVEKFYNMKERTAPLDLLNGGDGISINHVDASSYPSFMRR